MDASDVYYLARFLLAASRRVILPREEGRLSGTEQLVLEDLVAAAPTSVGDIARRTNIAQSRVSAIVSIWRARGDISVASDPSDRRRILLKPSDQLQSRYLKGATAALDDVFDALEVTLSSEERMQIAAALDLLHGRLRPDHA